ncbi:hypothetical protein Sjap_012475 [Stephania japonica]|uniref:Uncharacterized protein n=1 Tax=Stephania japonica TaxID=461633 RepID=A0AAP0NXN1_9MAGN
MRSSSMRALEWRNDRVFNHGEISSIDLVRACLFIAKEMRYTKDKARTVLPSCIPSLRSWCHPDKGWLMLNTNGTQNS